MTLPFWPFTYMAKNKEEKVVMKILQDSLKKSNDCVKFVTEVLKCVELGLYLREAGPRWDSIFLIALSQEYFNLYYRGKPMATSEFDINEEHILPLIQKYTHLNSVINTEDLTLVHNMKPQLDGKQICELYGIKPGKAIKHVMEEEIKYQILHPSADYDQVSQFLAEKQEDYLKKY